MNGYISAKTSYVKLTVYTPKFDKNGRYKSVKTYFHIIVCKAFSNHKRLLHQQYGGSYVVNHKNFKTVDYRIENLELVTHKKNSIGYPIYRRISRQTTYQIHKEAKYA